MERETINTADIKWAGPMYNRSGGRAPLYVAIALFLISALLLLVSRDILGAVLPALIGAVILYRSRREPPVVEFSITSAHIFAGGTAYAYEQIESFWIQYEPEYGIRELSLHLNRWWSAYVKIPLSDQNPVQVREYLLKFIPEEEHHETIVDVVSRWIGL